MVGQIPRRPGNTSLNFGALEESGYKFTRAVCTAINGDVSHESDFDLVDSIYIMSGVTIPKAIEEIRTAPVLHDIVCDKEDMKDQVKKFLNI